VPCSGSPRGWFRRRARLCPGSATGPRASGCRACAARSGGCCRRRSFRRRTREPSRSGTGCRRPGLAGEGLQLLMVGLRENTLDGFRPPPVTPGDAVSCQSSQDKHRKRSREFQMKKEGSAISTRDRRSGRHQTRAVVPVSARLRRAWLPRSYRLGAIAASSRLARVVDYLVAGGRVMARTSSLGGHDRPGGAVLPVEGVSQADRLGVALLLAAPPHPPGVSMAGTEPLRRFARSPSCPQRWRALGPRLLLPAGSCGCSLSGRGIERPGDCSATPVPAPPVGARLRCGRPHHPSWKRGRARALHFPSGQAL
jgi:hypothetical protein